MNAMTQNGNPARTRKQLSDQLDRLDGILDGLADALNASVTEAVKEATGIAVQEAVRGVLSELLTHPELMPQTQPLPPQAASGTSWRDRFGALRAALAARCRGVRRGCGAGVRAVQQGAAACWRGTRQAAGAVWSRCVLVGRLKSQLLGALAVGAVAAAVYWSGPWLVAAATTAGCFVVTVGNQAAQWLRRLLDRSPCPAG